MPLNRRDLCQLVPATLAVLVAPSLAEAVPAEGLDLSKYGIWHTESDYFIASSAEEACSMLRKHQGLRPGDEVEGTQPSDWERWPEDRKFPLSEEVEGPLMFLANHTRKPDEYYDFLPSRSTKTELPASQREIDELIKHFKKGSVSLDDILLTLNLDPSETREAIERDIQGARKRAARIVWLVDEGDVILKMTKDFPAFWVKDKGPGYLASTDF